MKFDKNKIIKYSKTIIIVLLGVLLFFSYGKQNTLKSEFQAYKKDGTAIIQYQSQTIKSLKKDKKELYDSIKNIKNVKQAAIIRYKYTYVGDTTNVGNKPDSLLKLKDSTYTFTKNSDTLSYQLKVNTAYVNWYNLNFTLNDKLTIINREVNGQNETTINTQNNGSTVTDIQIFNKKDNKNSFLSRFTYGPQIGYGLGIISKVPDIYIGFGITYRLNKIK